MTELNVVAKKMNALGIRLQKSNVRMADHHELDKGKEFHNRLHVPRAEPRGGNNGMRKIVLVFFRVFRYLANNVNVVSNWENSCLDAVLFQIVAIGECCYAKTDVADTLPRCKILVKNSNSGLHVSLSLRLD